MKYSRIQCIESYNHDKEMDFLFFWGHQPRRDGSIGKSCFSQWWPAPFAEDGIEYKTAEHYMMAEKARLFEDIAIHGQIVESNTPKAAKALGRKVSNFDNDTWLEHRYNIVMKANKLKFEQNSDLKNYLSNTGTKILVEASPVDNIWGVGLAEDHPDIKNPSAWRGDNLLGFILMEIRDHL